MVRRKLVALALLAVVSGLFTAITGCSRDPNVRKRKYLQSAQQYADQGRNREAMIQYMNALQLDPDYAEAHYGLAQVNLRLSAWSNAYLELSRTVELQPGNLKAQLDLANLQLGAGEYEPAMEKAELILGREPNNVGACVLQANVHAALGEKQASLQAMRKAISLAPDRSDLYNNLGVLLLKADQPAEAEASFQKAVELKPGSSEALVALAGFYQAQGRLGEAEQQYQRAIQAERKNLTARLALTRFYLLQNQRGKAEVVARETAALNDVPEAKTVLVDFYDAVGEKEKALQTAASLYAADRKNLLVKEAYVHMLLVSRQFEDAGRVNDEILKADSRNSNALTAKAQLYNHANRPSNAIELLESVLKVEPDNAVAHYALGVSANLMEDSARAEKEWREAARLRPNLVEAQQALASVAVQKGDLDLLARVSEELVNAQPGSPDGYALRALVAANRKEPAKVEADLQKAIAVAPQNPLGATKLGVWRLDQKKYAAAETLFEQALALDPNAAEALEGLVRIYADIQKNLSRAQARVAAQIQRAPSNGGYYLSLARLQNRSRDAKSAETSLRKAVELDPRNVEAYMLLAELQSASGRQDEAAATYDRLIQQNPRNIRAMVMLGILEQGRANWQRAQSLYEKALLVSPEYPAAANNLAYLLLEHGGSPEVALQLAQIARRSMPDSTSTADTLAWAYYQQGMYPAAVDLLEECVRKAPQNPNYHFHLGLALQKQNDKLNARRHLQQVLKIDPKYPNAQKVREALGELGS